MTRSGILIGLVVAVLVVVMSALFIVDEREKALVLRFGRVVDVKEEPGLAMKVPFIDNVVKYDDRILSIDTKPLEITPADERRLVVDAFARWRIVDVDKFRQATGAGGEVAARERLETIINNAVRDALGTVDSSAILSADRVALGNQITRGARSKANDLGVSVIDVRIKRADLPSQNLEATFNRMKAEREREAEDERARGREAAQKVRAQADRTKVELESEAQKQADIVRGEADARRNAIFADAFGRDPEFFAFYRSLSAYEKSLRGSNSTLVINPNSEFFEYLKTDTLGE